MNTRDKSNWFETAKPIWLNGYQDEKNITMGCRVIIDEANEIDKVQLSIAACNIYRLSINGDFINHGPARGPHGYYRVDTIEIGKYLINEANIIALEVVGYNQNSYYLLDQAPFLQAEIIRNGKVIASTAGEGQLFEAFRLQDRQQKTQRYSFQRPSSEAYILNNGYDLWKKDITEKRSVDTFSVEDNKQLLPRRLPYSDFYCRMPIAEMSHGDFSIINKEEPLWRDRSIINIGEKLKGFAENELETNPSFEVQRTTRTKFCNKLRYLDERTSDTIVNLSAKQWTILDFGTNLTGFMGARLTCSTKTKLFILFDEICIDDDVNFKRMGSINVITYELEAGEYELESMEPYTLRYMKLMVFEGECRVNGLYIREYTNPDIYRAQFSCSDVNINRLFEAGRETYRQNAVDIYMDCPSRERAGWLCDSFFTARVEFDLSGKAAIEKNFLENFLLPEKFEFLPEGMLPMCYPADHNDGVFIPNWSLWFVLELEEYLMRSGDSGLVGQLGKKINYLFKYFEKFENEFGLLESLENWIFVEWSKAEDFTLDVNFPTNMLYCAALNTAGRIYHNRKWIDKSENLKKVIYQHSFNGQFFIDNAIRSNGVLVPTNNTTEVCQYYAFYFNIASITTNKELWDTLINQFGPERDCEKVFPLVYPANAFIGNYLRLELLSRHGLISRLMDESIQYLLYMADKTGTLWEFIDSNASCNHGFASHIIRFIYRDIAGLSRVDSINKTIDICFVDTGLKWCNIQMPVEQGFISLRWINEDDKITYSLDVPFGYRVNIINRSGKKAVRKV